MLRFGCLIWLNNQLPVRITGLGNTVIVLLHRRYVITPAFIVLALILNRHYVIIYVGVNYTSVDNSGLDDSGVFLASAIYSRYTRLRVDPN